MLYISLSLSIAMLFIVNLLIARTKYPAPLAIVVCIGFGIGPFFYFMSFPAVTWQAKLMGFLVVVLVVPKWGRRLYFPLSLVATLVSYGLLVKEMNEYREQLEQVRQDFPFETMANRLPLRTASNSSTPLDSKRLQTLEDEVDSRFYMNVASIGTRALSKLHEDSVEGFVNTAGFGWGRMRTHRADISEIQMLKSELPERSPVRQPDYFEPIQIPDKFLNSKLQVGDTSKLLGLHDDGVLDFIHPSGMGYVKDREHVVGFQKHGMSKVPATKNWSVAHLELVGLVVQEKPVVYMTANLPQMEEVQTAPRRPLDSFELEGLEALRSGEDLYYRGSEDKARMMGSIRAVKQCLECHGGSHGDLLGAFSYGLRRE